MAWVRPVTGAFTQALRDTPQPLDPERAIIQHRGYVQALRRCGVAVTQLPVEPDHADACFVEDTALILSEDQAVVTRPGAASRRGEVESITRTLKSWSQHDLSVMPAPYTLDGGDVLRVGRRLFVGASSRTSPDGIDWLRDQVASLHLEVICVPVDQGLHLKSAVTVIDPNTILFWPGSVCADSFTAAGLETLEVAEFHGANVLSFGKKVLVSSIAPETARLIEQRGHEVLVLEVDEFHKADGALTCLSLRIPAPGSWCV